MKLIVITRPDFFGEEAQAIEALFRAGLELLHLRKPGASVAQVEELLRQIPAVYRIRIALHDHFELATPWGVGGIHLNARNPEAPHGWTGRISCSCHSLEEVRQRKDRCDYVFLSPIYDSISKAGYTAVFPADELRQTRQAGTLDRRVIALGGIDTTRLPEVERLGFGGAAMLGDVWNRLHTGFIPHFRQLKQAATTQRPPVILSIAGSDPSGGAGIQADIKTISALGGYAASVITAITVQNTRGVQAVHAVYPQAVGEQVAAVLEDLRVDAIKIGMLPDAGTVDSVADCLTHYPHGPVVYDPVMASTSGRNLMDAAAVRTARLRLFPCCALVTPNLPEAGLLCGSTVPDSPQAQEEAARTLAEAFSTAFLVKGGHLPGKEMCDVLCQAGHITRFEGRKVDSRNLHGTGCTLSSAIATCLGRGMTMESAVDRAKTYVTQAIRAGSTLGIGHGNGPLWHFFHLPTDECKF